MVEMPQINRKELFAAWRAFEKSARSLKSKTDAKKYAVKWREQFINPPVKLSASDAELFAWLAPHAFKVYQNGKREGKDEADYQTQHGVRTKEGVREMMREAREALSEFWDLYPQPYTDMARDLAEDCQTEMKRRGLANATDICNRGDIHQILGDSYDSGFVVGARIRLNKWLHRSS